MSPCTIFRVSTYESLIALNEREEFKKDKNEICNHAACDIRFKTGKQKVHHHNKLEPECKTAKVALMKLIAKYKKMYLKLCEKYEDKSECFIGLKRRFKRSYDECIDTRYFNTFVGENFYELPK
jgi:hypothetical protein